MTPVPARIATLDAVRGFAVMGILLLNIVDFAMPGYAYVDPHFYGGAEGANWAVWAVNYVIADGKMRGLFTMLFGASTVLVAEQAVRSGESPVRVHYARIAALFVFGMVHAYLIWSGDILVLYSVVGAVVFLAWRWRTQTLLAVGVLLLAFNLLGGLIDYAAAAQFRAAATAPEASPTLRRQWHDYLVAQADSVAARGEELAAYRGTYATALPVRAETALYMQTAVNAQMLPDTAALMLIGMALFRLGFFSGAWSRRSYWRFALLGYAICLPLYAPLVWWIDATRFSPVTLVATEAIHLSLLRPWLSLAHAAMVILFVQSGAWLWLAERLAATGRMAFSNYIGTSIVCTLIFNGYGLGWFGYLERWQCYPIVFGVWAVMLLWSKPWLDRFAYGPLEWLWRSAARGQRQTLRRSA